MKKSVVGIGLLGTVLFVLLSCSFGGDESGGVSISRVAFAQNGLSIAIGESLPVALEVGPEEARINVNVDYTVTEEGYIELSNMSNQGLVIKGIKPGSVVLVAKCSGFTSYLEIRITGEVHVDEQYIVLPAQVVEVSEQARKTISVSLYGGLVTDNAEFVWKLEEKEANNIEIATTENNVVITGVLRGSQKIQVSHPKAKYDTEILVYVNGVDDLPVYITTDSNVLLVDKYGTNKRFNVNLINGFATDVQDFQYTITEGSGLITILTNNENCSVTALQSGTAVISVSHPKAEYDLKVRIIVIEGEGTYITLDKTFILLDIGGSASVSATLSGEHEYAALNDFSFTVSRDDVIDVIQANNDFFIMAKNSGTVKILVHNDHVIYDGEILIVVRNEAGFIDDTYITTSQNIIQLEMGEGPVSLHMQLVGGVEADRNSFSWVVDDSTIIDVESSHGEVRYTRAVKDITDVFNAIAVITPKKVGSTKIEVSHPKSEVNGTILVKVYPRGTFNSIPILVGTEGLLKVVTGDNVDVTLNVISGAAADVGELDWTTNHTSIATVTGAGLTGNIVGVTSGLTQLVVKGEALRDNFEGLIQVGTAAELAGDNVIYVDTIFQHVYTGQNVSVEVKDSLGILANSTQYSINVSDSEVVYARMIKSRLAIQGLKAGETLIEVRNSHVSVINTFTIRVTVESDKVSIDHPYSIVADNFIGIVKGETVDFRVNLVGGTAVEEGKLIWSNDTNPYIRVTGNGNMARFEALDVGQTKVTISHLKSINAKDVIVYVVANVSDLQNKVLIASEKENYLLRQGEELFLKLITNGTAAQLAGINWSVNPIGIVTVDSNYDSAYIRADSGGNTKITVSHTDNVMPLTIFVSVSTSTVEKDIYVPAIVEMVVNDNKIVQAQTLGLSGTEINDIRWTLDNPSDEIVRITGEGDKAYLFGMKKGQNYLTVRQTGIGYSKKILVVVANTREELENTYVMASETTFFRLKRDDEKTVHLVFGQAGFPETAKAGIEWTVSNNNVVRVSGSGARASIVALNEGVAVVKAHSAEAFKDVEITVEVYNEAIAGDVYNFLYTPMIGIVCGNTENITVQLLNGDNPVTAGLSQITMENQHDDIISVTGNELSYMVMATNKAGQSYITLRHPKVLEPARILIYTAATQQELDNAFPISVVKTNYLITAGETVKITLNTISDESAKLAKITWGTENSAIFSITLESKKVVQVTGVGVGNGVITIRYDGTVVERIYISVKEAGNADYRTIIITESIIGVVVGQTKSTKISHNIANTELGNIQWASENTTKVGVVGNGESAAIEGKALGECYVVVNYNGVKRYILVYVAATQADLANKYAMNIDNQYYRMGPNDSLNLSVYFGPKVATAANTVWSDEYDNNVVNITPNGGKAKISGLNEGIAVIRIHNDQCATDILVYVEVANKYAGEVVDNTELKYLSIPKTIYVLNPDTVMEQHIIRINAIGFTEDEYAGMKWEKSNATITMIASGLEARIFTQGTEGETVVTVSHAKSSNKLEIKFIISRDPVYLDIPYIHAESEVVRVGLNVEKQLKVEVKNLQTVDLSKFSVTSNNTNIETDITGDMVTITGRKNGQSLLTIAHESCEYTKQIVVLVTLNEDGLIYLTTGDNFSVIEKGSYKTLRTELKGYEDPLSDHYVWETDTPDIISINGSGLTGLVTAKEIGTGHIRVYYVYAPDYAIDLYVRVSSVANVKPVYITTDNNIISVINGNSMTIKARLVNGSESEYSQFNWSSNNSPYVQINFSGETCLIKGIKEGVGTITISHSSSLNAINIVVLVEPDMTSSNLYITTGTTLIEMKPTDANRSVNARLVGGNPEDVYGFNWAIASYESDVKFSNGSSYPVIEVVANADNAYIIPKKEGTAVIAVTHPKTSYRLDIRVNVKQYTKIKFSQTNATIDMGESLTVPIEVPSGMTVVYEVTNENVASVTGTSKVCIIEGYSGGTVIVTARNITGTASDELVVKVNHVDGASVKYIQTSVNLVAIKLHGNNAAVKATPVGIGNGNDAITGLQWNSINPNIVSVFGTGDQVQLRAISVGQGVVTVTHPTLMPGYVKRIYVQVDVDESMFTISDYFLDITEGEEKRLKATVTNVPDINYITEFVWESSDDSVARVFQENDGFAKVVGIKDGDATITVTYGGVPLQCSVRVTEPRSLEIIPVITIMPNEHYIAVYKVTPFTENVVVTATSGDSVEFTLRPDKREIEFVGRNFQDDTIFSVMAHGLECLVQVKVTFTPEFHWRDKSSIRTSPKTAANDTTTIFYYDILPAKDAVTLRPALSQDTTVADYFFDKDLQTVTLVPKKCGYLKLLLRHERTGQEIPLEIFVYYESINVQWSFSTGQDQTQRLSNTTHSRVDEIQRAIYLADGEYVNINPYVYESSYPGSGLMVTNAVFEGSGNPFIGFQPSTSGGNGYGYGKIYAHTASGAGLTGNYADSLNATKYVGLFKITYGYWNGRDTKGSFTKSYLVYQEIWRRK